MANIKKVKDFIGVAQIEEANKKIKEAEEKCETIRSLYLKEKLLFERIIQDYEKHSKLTERFLDLLEKKT